MTLLPSEGVAYFSSSWVWIKLNELLLMSKYCKNDGVCLPTLGHKRQWDFSLHPHPPPFSGKWTTVLLCVHPINFMERSKWWGAESFTRPQGGSQWKLQASSPQGRLEVCPPAPLSLQMTAAPGDLLVTISWQTLRHNHPAKLLQDFWHPEPVWDNKYLCKTVAYTMGMNLPAVWFCSLVFLYFKMDKIKELHKIVLWHLCKWIYV